MLHVLRTTNSWKAESGLSRTHWFERELKYFSRLKYCNSVLQFCLWEQWRFACLQVNLYRVLYIFLGKLGSKGKGCPSVWTSCSAGFLKGGEVAPLEHAPHVWDSAWDWPRMQWPTEVWGIWKKAEKRVGNMLESRNWPTAKSRSLKKKNFSPDSEISYASHSTQVEPEISSSRKQDERKIPSYQGHSEQKDFLPTLNLKCWSAALSFHLLKTLFFLLYYFCFLTKHNFED